MHVRRHVYVASYIQRGLCGCIFGEFPTVKKKQQKTRKTINKSKSVCFVIYPPTMAITDKLGGPEFDPSLTRGRLHKRSRLRRVLNSQVRPV